jgi:hypothetical protein
MAISRGPKMVTSGLVLALDAADRNSYISGSSTWNDLSGNNYNGTLISGSSFSNDNGGSITFNGIDGRVDFGTSLNFDYSDFSVCIWAKSPTDTSGASGFPIHVTNLIGKGDWNSNASWRIGYKSSGANPATAIAFSHGITWSSGPSLSVNSFDLSQWNHFVGVATPTQQFLYLNGSLVNSVTQTKISVTNAFQFQLGRSSYINRWFTGNLNNILIYNTSISSTDVLNIYNATKSRFGL